jgi:hypothetical protein
VDRSSAPHETLLEQPCKGTGEQGDLGILGKAPTTGLEPLYSEIITEWPMRHLKPGQLVKLLNSSSQGKVISERQLYKHRQRADACFYNGNRIDLFRYVAWLIDLRQEYSHLFRSPSRRKIKERRKKEHTRLLTSPGLTGITCNSVLDLIEKQGRCCALTGRALEPSTAALDHVIPISRGGIHCIENAQVLQKDVNRAKGTLTNEEFIQLCCEVAAHVNRINPKKRTKVKSSCVDVTFTNTQKTLFC